MARSGDIFLVTAADRVFVDRLVRFGQRLRFPLQDARFIHTGIVVDDTGTTVEALINGVEYGHLSRYAGDTVMVPIEDATQRASIVRFACSRVGDEYSILSCVCLFLSLATGCKLRFGIKGDYICSGLVAAAMDHAGIDLGDDPEWMTPAEIAQWADVPAAVEMT